MKMYKNPVGSTSLAVWPDHSLDLGYRWCAQFNDGPIYYSEDIYKAINLTGISLGDLEIAKLYAKKLGYDFNNIA